MDVLIAAAHARAHAENREGVAMDIDLGVALDALPAMMWTASPDGRIDFVNRRWLEYTGLRRDEPHDREWQATVNADDLAELLDRWRSIVASGEDGEMEARMRRFDGDYRWFLVRSSPLRDAAGRILKWYGINTEIDDRKRAEQALRDSEQGARSVVDGIPGLVAVFTASGELELVNNQVVEYYGKTLEELRRWDAGELTHPDDLPRAVEIFTRSLASGDPFEMEVRSRRFDGAYRWLQSRGFPLRDADGRIVRWYNLLVDVDERRRAEEALRASETNLRLIIDSIPGMVCTMSAAGEVQLLSRQILDYFGKSSEDLIGWQFTDAVHPDDLPRVLTAFTHSITTGDPYDIEHRCRRADGVYRWFQVRALPVRDADGRITGWYVVLVDIDDRKRAEDAIRASQRDLKLIIDTIPALAWSARPDGSAEFLSQHYLDYIGLSAEQAKDWGWTAAVHPDDLSGLAATWQSMLASGSAGEAEARLRRPDGAYRWFLFRANPLRDRDGTIVKWYGVNADIDERKRAEEALRQSEARLAEAERDLQLTIDTIPVFVAAYRPDGTRTFVNRSWQHYMGIAPDAATDADAADLPHFHPDDVERNDRAWRAALASGEPVSIELRVRRADGQYRWHTSRRVPLRDERGNIVRWYWVGIDIEDQKRAEAELRRSEAFLAEGQRLSLTGNFSWLLDPDEIVFSDQLYRIFGFDKDAPVTLEWIMTRVHPDDIPLLTETIERARAGGDDLDYEMRLQMPDKEVRYLRTIAHGVRRPDGRMEYLGAVQDVTERRLSEEALGKLRSELAHVTRVTSLGAMTASIAHEVNQPLAGIITNASTSLRMLAADPPNIEGARETARRTIRDGNRAADVIARLRALFSQRATVIEPVDLNEAAREVIALSWGDLHRSRVAFSTEFADGLPLVGGDRVQLQQVIMNLLRNAADAMRGVDDRPRLVVIRTEAEAADQVRLSVQDAGVGFGSQGLERLFEAFYTTKSDGMGMGLSISRSIIDSHHGRLWATANDGPGATFSFTIPA
jgi:PAS domain S-box-containing protein